MSGPTVDALLGRATDITFLTAVEGKSGARLERAQIDGESHVIKHVVYADDWLAQTIRDVNGAAFRAWDAGLMDRLPACLDHATVAMSYEATDDGYVMTMVMRDVSASLVPEGDALIDLEQHLRFLDHMAELQAAFWGWRDDIGLIGLHDRYSIMTLPRVTQAASASPDAVVPPLIIDGWRQLPDRAPQMAAALFALHEDPKPLVDALADTPTTFLHGDWKLAQLGSHPDGRTVLVDWAYPGEGPPCAEFAHYLALNRRRIPQSKDDAVAAYRAALERAGVDTADWFDRQITLALLGMMSCTGWEKALGDEDELRWWEARVLEGAALL